MTVFFLPPNASCYFPEAPTETSERKWSEEKQREKVTQQLRGQMKKKKRSAGLIGLRQRTEVTSRLQRICKLAIPTPSESRILTISSAPFTWDDLRVSLPCSIPGPMQRQWQSCSVRSDSLRPHRLYPTWLLCAWNFPGKNTGVGCHFLLQGIFSIQGLNPCLLRLLHRQANSLSWCHLGSHPWASAVTAPSEQVSSYVATDAQTRNGQS